MPLPLTRNLSLLADAVLRRSDPGTESVVWRWILDRLEPYPSDTMIAPLRPPTRPDAPRRIVAVRFVPRSGEPLGISPPVAVRWTERSGTELLRLSSGATGASELAAAIFTHRHRGALLVLEHGSVSAMPLLLRYYARHLVRSGWTIQPIAAGAELRALIVRRDRHTWILCDAGAMTGLKAEDMDRFLTAYAPSGTPDADPLRALQSAVSRWQQLTIDLFGAQASPTIGRTAIRAAARHIGERSWLWRPHPLMVAMLRAGGGYRGGYAAGSKWRGIAYRADMNKAYASALASPLPLRLGLVLERGQSDPVAGAYLCRVQGQGSVPIYIGAWIDQAVGFERALWSGGDTFAVLTLTEVLAIRRLGYAVTVGIGMGYLSTFSLRGLLASITQIVRVHGRGSPQERIARIIGNSVYGKLAERPEREQLIYAAERPGPEFNAALDPSGNEYPDLWTATQIAYRAHQHIDSASEITSIVRARLYDAIGSIRRAGGVVPHADTDGLLSSIDPSPYLEVSPTEPGRWRVDSEPAYARVWGAKGYSYGVEIHAAGVRGMSVEQADQVLSGETIEVEMTQRSAPWGSAPLLVPMRRRVSAR